jgi:hypothetical protein
MAACAAGQAFRWPRRDTGLYRDRNTVVRWSMRAQGHEQPPGRLYAAPATERDRGQAPIAVIRCAQIRKIRAPA